uniref:endo-1,4-beta-xylanase n=1 Tax=Attheya septentrionalis TaxID=420275 RepID=A0A7S2UN11_9STRA|mmetsp:Transcript_5215/g.9154  ORF Transcript_5215/g.9154 Transcript_5215/m.9154 type:complete len:453 (+) Transcript_5215:111-1469(+)
MAEHSWDSDGPTLKEVVAQCCKRIDIGTAVLPKPLFLRDVEVDETEEGGATSQIAGATVDVIAQEGEDVPHGLRRSGKESKYAKVLQGEFNAIVIEHHLKWAPLCETLPGPISPSTPSTRIGRYDFEHVDQMVDWALSKGIKVKGHVLIWHVTTPGFINEQMSASQMREHMRRHIFTTVGHFRGRIHMWDVVNEALAPDGTLAQNIFLKKLGPSYIEDAFRWAHEADPTAFLIYNDNKVEGMGGPNADKSNGFYSLLKGLKEKGVPVHGAGMQAHFNAGGVGRQRCPTPRMVKQQICRLGDLGLKVNISEMDVRVSKLPKNLQEVAQTQIYRDILAAALSEPAFDGIWLWGFSDRHTWVKQFYYDDQPLVFDEVYSRKPSYHGLRDAIATLAPGGSVGGGVPLTSDHDAEGNAWGHLWMQPEPKSSDPVLGTAATPTADDVGDSRPDWLQST